MTQLPKRNNEFTIATSYYEIFTRNRQTSPKESDGCDQKKEATNPMSTSLQQQQQQQNRQDFWTEDVWTESDEELAQQTLQNHLEKCSINSIVNNQTQEEEEDAIAWDQFYKDHGTKFFKDRHYLEKAFPEVFLEPSQQQQNQQQPPSPSSSSLTKPKTLVEIGCGVGNAILPLLEDESR